MLMKTIANIKKVIKGRPIVQYYVQLYTGDDIWKKDTIKTNIKFHLLHIYRLTYIDIIGIQKKPWKTS